MTTENSTANMKEKNIAVFPHLYLHSVYKVWVQGIQIKCLHFYTEQERILPVISMWYYAEIHPLRSGLFKFKAPKISQSVVVLAEGISVAEVYSYLLNLWLRSGSQTTFSTLQESKISFFTIYKWSTMQ